MWEPSTVITDLFYKTILSEEAARSAGRGVKKDFYDSEVTDCRRKLYYALSGEKEERPKEPEGILTMKMGDWVQFGLEDIMRQAGILITKELRLVSDVTHGRFDDLVFTDGFKIVEIKSVNTEKFYFVQKNPEDSHLAQINRYLIKTKLNDGYLIYICRDGKKKMVQHPIMEYHVTADPVMFAQQEGRLLEVRRKFEAKILPKRDFNKPEKYPCAYCGFAEVCWKRDEKLEGE